MQATLDAASLKGKGPVMKMELLKIMLPKSFPRLLTVFQNMAMNYQSTRPQNSYRFLQQILRNQLTVDSNMTDHSFPGIDWVYLRLKIMI